ASSSYPEVDKVRDKVPGDSLTEPGDRRNQDIGSDTQTGREIERPLPDSRNPCLVGQQPLEFSDGTEIPRRFGARVLNFMADCIELGVFRCANAPLDLLHRPDENPDTHGGRK